MILQQMVIQSLLHPLPYLEIQRRRSAVWDKLRTMDCPDALGMAKCMVALLNRHVFGNQLLSAVRRVSGKDLVIRLMNEKEKLEFGGNINVYIDDEVQGEAGFHMIINPNVLRMHGGTKTSFKKGFVSVDGWRCTSPEAILLLVIEHELVHVMIRCAYPPFFSPEQEGCKLMDLVGEELAFLSYVGVNEHRLHSTALAQLLKKDQAREEMSGHGMIFCLLSNSLVGHVGTHTAILTTRPYVKNMMYAQPTFAFADETTAHRDLIRCSTFS